MLTQEKALIIWKLFDEAGLGCSLHAAHEAGRSTTYTLTASLEEYNVRGLATLNGLIERFPDSAQAIVRGGRLEIL